MVGHVSKERFEELLRRGRELVDRVTRSQLELGDMALEIEPMGTWGGEHAAGEEQVYTVESAIGMFAEGLGLATSTVLSYRWTASRWPVERRRPGVSYSVFEVLASIPDAAERFATVADEPVNERTGRTGWWLDEAKRVVGRRVNHPTSRQERVEKIRDLARDDTVAALATADLLRRPEVAAAALGDTAAKRMVNTVQFEDSRAAAEVAADLLRRPEVAAEAMSDTAAKQVVNKVQFEDAGAAAETATELLRRPAVARRAMSDPAARSAVNTAQFDNSRQFGEGLRERFPALDRVERTAQFIDLIGVCVGFVTSAGRVIPSLRGHEFTDDERAVVASNIARIRATADWLESVLETGAVDLDGALARILQGE
ncbi:DUF6192 family protein [Yinghuangia sp. YIM S09857]|uniref:DUF6192 family protein n=1 Tax=Yinghuangia sp. YIM S09857 TaxID=3436929 RepID=UPI003F5314DB